MAINRYDTPAQAEFINTYVPIPFEEMMKIGMLKQARIEQGQTEADSAVATLNAIRVAAPDEKDYIKKQSDYIKRIDQLTQDSTPGSNDFLRGLSKLKMEMSVDPELRDMAQNYAPYNKLVTAVKEAEAKYGDNSAAAYKPRKQLNDFYNGTTNDKGEAVRGSAYLRQTQGTGILEPVGVGTPADAQPVLYKYLAPVKEDSAGTEGIDQSGLFKIGNQGSNITFQKLASVLGIMLKEEVIKGKTVTSVDEDAKIQVPMDFRNTEAGMYMQLQAEQIADSSKGKVTEEYVFEQLYKDAAVTAIKAHVSTSSKQTLDVNPYAFETTKRAQEKQKPLYTTPFLIGKGKTDFDSLDKVTAARDALATKVLEIQKAKESYIQTYNYTGKDPNQKDKEGNLVAAVLKQFDANAMQEEDKIKSMDKMLEDVKKDLQLSNWNIEQDFTKDEMEDIRKRAYRRAEAKATQTMYAAYGVAATGPMFEEYRAAFTIDFTKQFMEEGSPNFKRINTALKENAANTFVKVGVTNMPTTEDENAVQEIAFKFTNEGAGKENQLGGGGLKITDAKTGIPYSKEEYLAMSRTNDPKSRPLIMGMFYDTKTEYPQILARFIDKKGNMLQAAHFDAPEGTEDIFIRAGKISAAELIILRGLANISNSPSRTGSIGNVNIRIDQPSRIKNSAEGEVYQATFTNPKTKVTETIPFGSREALINAYVLHVQAEHMFNTTGKLPEGME